VVHERFLTDTARYADIVLPATSSLEHPDLYRSYGHYFAQRCDAVIPPVGESRSNWDVFRALAEGMGFDNPFFRQTADELVSTLLERASPWRDSEADRRLRLGAAARLVPPSDPKRGWLTPSGRIEIRNDREADPLPRLLPTHAESDGYPLRLQPAATPHALNSSFYERDDLRGRQRRMTLMMNGSDAGDRGLSTGDPVVAFNGLGEVRFTLEATDRVPPGTVVTEGVWWSGFLSGDRGVNALTSQRLTDGGRGSTLYDATVEVRKG
jgi:anaerobic selenocysteine-containing dehydrogenase